MSGSISNIQVDSNQILMSHEATQHFVVMSLVSIMGITCMKHENVLSNPIRVESKFYEETLEFNQNFNSY